jgi:CAAX protease family protein
MTDGSAAGPGGMMCSVCAASLRAGARFCGRCGAEQGLMVARDAGAGPALREPSPRSLPLDGRGLAIALGAYFVLLMPSLYFLARQRAMSLGEIDFIEWWVGAVGVLGLATLGRDALRGLGLPRIGGRGAALALIATAGVLAVVQGLERALPGAFLDDLVIARVFDLGLVGTLLHLAVLPAITEEIAYRGVVLGGLRGVFSDRTAIAVSAMMFAISHLAVPSLLHLTLLGAVLGAVRVRSNSLWPCMLIHAGYNAAIVLLAW